MSLTNYLSGLLSKFKDSRVTTNVMELVRNIIEHKSIQLWGISADKAEYDRSRRLLDGSLKSILDADKSSSALREQSVSVLGKASSLVLLHDPCDIRKAESAKLEYLGTVRDLDGGLINGYSTFNTVGVEIKGKQLQPIDITVYSNGDDHYVTVKELAQYEKGQLQASEDAVLRDRAAQIEAFMAEKSHVNLPLLVRQQLKRVSGAFKQENPQIILKHVLDRQFDDVGLFEFIDQELGDEFVILLKLSRNSNEVKLDEETGAEVTIKLKDVEFEHRQLDLMDKLTIKKQQFSF